MPWLEVRLGAPLPIGTRVTILPGGGGAPCKEHSDWVMHHGHADGAIGVIVGGLDEDGDYMVSVDGYPMFVHHNGVEVA